MAGSEDFQNKYFAAKTNLEKVQLFIKEGRYKVATRADKPNLMRITPALLRRQEHQKNQA